MIPESLKAQILPHLAGLSHGQREGLALDLAALAAGEDVAFLRCDRAGLVGWMKPEGAGVRFTQEEDDFIRRCGQDPAKVAAAVAEEQEKKRRADGPLHLTDREAAELRRHGHSPELIARMDECHSVEDYRRLKAELDGGGAR